MINLNIDEIKPGMVLARPVRNRQGVLLLEAGARISKKNIRIFKSWGVLEASIKGKMTAADGPAAETEFKLKESVEQELREKFCDVLDDPVMVHIFKAASKQLVRDIQHNGSENEHS